MKNLIFIESVLSLLKANGVTLNDLNAYANNHTETEKLASPEQEPSSSKQLPLEILYEGGYSSFYFETGKIPIAIICGNIGFAFEDAPKEMFWHDAKTFCEKYSVGGLKWYLPNKESGHLDILYKNKEAINVVLAAFGKEPLKEDCYWSSSEYNNSIVWYMTLSDGSVNTDLKYYDNYYVRPVLLF